MATSKIPIGLLAFVLVASFSIPNASATTERSDVVAIPDSLTTVYDTTQSEINPNLLAWGGKSSGKSKGSSRSSYSSKSGSKKDRSRSYSSRSRESSSYSRGRAPKGSTRDNAISGGMSRADRCSGRCERNSRGQLVTEINGQWHEVRRSGQRNDGGSGNGSRFPRGLCTFVDFGKFSWTDYLAGCGCYEHKTNAGDGTKDTDIRCRCDQCEVCNYCGDCAQGSAPPVRADFGNSCTSPANLCGQTNAGTIECDGCTATTPALPSDYYSFHTSSPNVCGDTNSVQIQCGNRATTPPNTQCTATVDDLTIDPDIVRKDDTTEITWGCTYADYAVLYNITNGDRFILTDGTTLTAPNGETYTALGGTVTTGAIIAESDYILECHGEFSNSTTTASTTIRVLPRYDEN